MLPKVNKADMVGTIESIKEYLRSHHSIIRMSLAYIIRKNVTAQTHGYYPKYATSDDKMFPRMLNLLPDKNKLHNEQSAD